jgi:2-dehydropantoate 2-reductase
MRIAVVGVGGVGGYFGGRLAQAGEQVVFIARGANLEALRTRGLRVESTSGDFELHTVEATDDPGRVGAVDAVLITVKAWQVPEVAQAIRPLVGPETCVVPLQNGVEAPEQLAAVLGPGHVVGGLCGIVSFIVAPGHIRHAAADPFVQIGELDDRPSPRVDQLRQALERAGVRVDAVPSIQTAMWMKYLFIAPWSGIGALTRAPIGVWRTIPETRRMCEQAISEVLAVGRARGVMLPDDALERTLSQLDGVAPEATSSMQRDVMAGRPSELDAQIGAAVRMGEAVGVQTPLHTFIHAALLPMEQRARGQVEFTP